MSTANGKKPLNGLNTSGVTEKVELLLDRIKIHELEVFLPDALNYLQHLPESERERACVRAFEIGFFCLQRTQTRSDVDFVKRQMESLLSEFHQAVAVIPETIEKRLVHQLGTQDGQLLAPVQHSINLTQAVLTTQVNEVRTLLAKDIDPSKQSSVLGSALKKIQDLLDSKRSDSVQGTFTTALAKVTTSNGALASSVKAVVAEAIAPLALEVKELAQEIREQELVESVLEQTIAKGASYEEAVLLELQDWAKLGGAEVHYVAKRNQPGDILIKLTSHSLAAIELSIIIEARNRPSERWGRKAISGQLAKAMALYEAKAAIFVSRSRQGLASEVGEWTDGVCSQGIWVATTHELLTVAIQFLVVRHKLTEQQAHRSKLDCNAIESQITRIQSSLDYIQRINTHLTALQENTEGIRAKAQAMKAEIRSALTSISEALNQEDTAS
ncbi:MAG: hypothetical protein AB1589_40580 [Cyanobacteriota bacterium]